jgi:hypothetical protein
MGSEGLRRGWEGWVGRALGGNDIRGQRSGLSGGVGMMCLILLNEKGIQDPAFKGLNRWSAGGL